MKKYLFVIPLLFISYFATSETYFCSFTYEEVELIQIERIDEKIFLEVNYPNHPPWKIFYENNDVLILTTTYNLENADYSYELWILYINKKNLTHQLATLGSTKELLPYPVVNGKCYVKQK